MEVSISAQLSELIRFAALGLGLGLLYDLLRPMRYSGRGALLWDGLFCAAAAAGCFVLSMARGRLGIWSMGSALLMFCMYINFLSPLLLPAFLGTFKTMHIFRHFIVEKAEKLQKLVKKFFTNPKD